MHIETQQKSNVVFLRIAGPVNSMNKQKFETVLLSFADLPGCRLIIDLSRVDYVSSGGLRVFLMGAKAALAGGGLIILFGMAEVVRKVFVLSGFIRIMTVVESEAEAVALAASA